MAMSMNYITTQTTPETNTLSFSGKLDFTVRKELQAALKQVQTEGIQQIILDLTKVTFIDCAAIGILVRTKQEFDQVKKPISIVAGSGRVSDVLKVLNIDKMLPVLQPL